MMENAKTLINEYVALAEEILVEFCVDENSALTKLSALCSIYRQVLPAPC